MSEPIETYLDDLLRRTRADARTARRLVEEAGDHLYATAAELEAGGLPRETAETEERRGKDLVPYRDAARLDEERTAAMSNR